MPLKLYFTEISPPCRTVKMVLEYLNMPVEIIEINLYNRDHLSPEFVKLNPTHTIPLLDDNGFLIFDSHAIATYLISKYGKDDSMYPKDLQKRARVDEQLHYSNEVFGLFKLITKPVLYQKNPNVSNEDKDKLLEILNIFEKILEKQDYTAGDQLTLADLSHISLIPSFEVYVPMSEDKFPRLNAWLARCIKNIKNYDEVNGKGVNVLTNNIAKVINEA